MLSETEAALHRFLTDAEDDRDRYKAALEEIASYEVVADDDSYLDALALQAKAREALALRQTHEPQEGKHDFGTCSKCDDGREPCVCGETPALEGTQTSKEGS